MKTRLYWISVFLIIAALFLIKWQDLSLPSYWDEAYPYAYAIHWQVDHGLSLSPSGMPEIYSTGHPTLYYFLQAAWIKFTGEGLLTSRLFPLFISSLLLLAVYKAGSKLFSPRIGLMAVLFLFTRNIFLAQSSFMLPETLMALLTILALQAWFEEKRRQYIIWSSLLLLTKEPAIMLIVALSLWELIRWYRSPQKKLSGLIKRELLTVLPVLTFIGFFAVQRIQKGWFFFPRHLGAMSGQSSEIFFRLKQFVKMFAFSDGAFIFTLAVLVSAGFLFIKNRNLLKEKTVIIGTCITFGLLFVLLSSMNFYNSARYILCLYPLWFILSAWIIDAATIRFRSWSPAIITVFLAASQLVCSFSFRNDIDANLGYADRVRVQDSAIRWMISEKMQNKNVYAIFLMANNLRDKAPGYVKENEIFQNLSSTVSGQTQLMIATDLEPFDAETNKIPKKLLKRWEIRTAWAEVWERIP